MTKANAMNDTIEMTIPMPSSAAVMAIRMEGKRVNAESLGD
jgi:hypothetical protein